MCGYQTTIPYYMRFRPLAYSVVASSALLQWASGQDFTNLEFDSAVVVPIGGSVIEFSPAFPGWTGYIGTNVATEAIYNEIYLDSSGISLYGDPAVPIFEATLQAGYLLNAPGISVDTTLSQTGLIPAGTQSLLFDGSFDGQANGFAVTLNGQTLSLVPLSTDSSFTVYGASINAWAGQTATLAFTVFPQQPHTGDNYLTLSDIQFSDSPVPEPSVFVLFVLSSLFFGAKIINGPEMSSSGKSVRA
jgi:hypothetical protein